MNVFDAIEQRRSVKHFDPEYKFSEAEEKKLLEAAVFSPTAFNLQHWRFVVVKDKAILEQLKEAAWGQAQVTDASMLIVLCADKAAWSKEPGRYWVNAPQEVQDYLVPKIGQYYEGNDRVQQDECMRSCGLAAQTIMLAAKAMGYDSCLMDGFDFEQAGKIISLPDDHIISMFIAIGKATAEANPRGGQLPLSEVVIENHF